MEIAYGIKFYGGWINQISKFDLPDLILKRVNIKTMKPVEVATDSGETLTGYFSSYRCADNPPHVPHSLTFVETTMSAPVSQGISPEEGAEFILEEFEWIEFIPETEG